MRRLINSNIKFSISDTIPILVLSIAGTDFAYDCLFCLLVYTYTKQIKLSFANAKPENMLYKRIVLHQLQHS